MATELKGSVEITSREETVYDEPPGTTKLSRVLIHRSFTGDVEGTSVANLLLAQGEGGGGYMAQERFTGSIGGKSGTVVFRHGRLNGGPEPIAFGEIVGNSGTGDLAGVVAAVAFAFSPDGASITVTLSD
jgi:hypothetical protein